MGMNRDVGRGESVSTSRLRDCPWVTPWAFLNFPCFLEIAKWPQASGFELWSVLGNRKKCQKIAVSHHFSVPSSNLSRKALFQVMWDCGVKAPQLGADALLFPPDTCWHKVKHQEPGAAGETLHTISKALNALNGRKRNANATFAQNLKSTCILQLLHLGSKDVESITASVLTVDIFVGVSLIHDQQERVFITLDSFEKQAKGLVVTHIACQDSPGFQKLITCSNIFEAKLDCQAPCTLIAWVLSRECNSCSNLFPFSTTVTGKFGVMNPNTST